MVYIISSPDQTQLLPTDLRDLIPENHLCYLIEDVIDQMDFSAFDEKVDGPGNPSYHPRILLKILINGICERVTSTRKLAKLTKENIIFKYLAENLVPDFHTIAAFRKENSGLIKDCFLQTVKVAKELEMVNFNKLYLDGTKIKANASKGNNFTKEEIDFLSDFVDKQMKNMDEADEKENSKFSNSDGEPKIPDHLTKRSKLKKKIKEILDKSKKAKDKIAIARMMMSEKRLNEINLSDMESKLMKMKQDAGYRQAYNCQLIVEDKGEIIVGNYLSNNAADATETEPAMEKFKAEQNVSLANVEVFQDNGYSCCSTAEYYEKEGATAYIPDEAVTKITHGKEKDITKYDIDNFEYNFEKDELRCPEGHNLKFARKDFYNKKRTNWSNIYRTDKCKACSHRAECITNKKDIKRGYREARINPLMRRIRLRFKTKGGIEKYNQRFHKGEIAQAQILHNFGYREFRCRGMKSCENEVNLFSAAYNLKKIYGKIRESTVKISQIIEKGLSLFDISYFFT